MEDNQKDFKKFCPFHSPKDGSAIPKPFPTDILFTTFTPTDTLLLLYYFWGCFMASHVSSLQCLATLMVKELPLKFSRDLSHYRDTYWENEPGFFFWSQVQWKGVIKIDVRKSLGSLQPEYQVKKSRSDMSCSGSEDLQTGQQHHHLLEGANLANVPVATRGVRNAFGRYAT